MTVIGSSYHIGWRHICPAISHQDGAISGDFLLRGTLRDIYLFTCHYGGERFHIICLIANERSIFI